VRAGPTRLWRPRRLPSGERPLAVAEAADGTLVAGTRDALHLGDTSLPWEHVERADWDADASTLTVTELGAYGEQRPVHRLVIEEPGRLLELVRERVTATIVIQRHVPVRGRRGLAVIARRPARGATELRWFLEYDEGVDPEDPSVRKAAESAYAELRREVGLD
jgi:hypothetical protein